MATEVVTAPIKQPDPIANIVVLLVQYWVYIAMAFLAIIIIVTIILLIKRMKKRVDPFKDEYQKVKALCKFQADPTLKEVYLISDAGLKHIGHYMGEAVTHDGFRNILFWKFKKWYLFWFPARFDFFDVVKETMIIRSNVNKTYTYREYDPKTKVESLIKAQLTKDIISKSEDKILIRGFGLERMKYFLYPVLRDKDGDTIDKSIEIFERERNPALISAMYQQAEDFANVSRELVNMNPSVRVVKTTDGQLNPQKSEGGNR